MLIDFLTIQLPFLLTGMVGLKICFFQINIHPPNSDDFRAHAYLKLVRGMTHGDSVAKRRS